MRCRLLSNRSGFTLIEIICVLVLLATLASLCPGPHGGAGPGRFPTDAALLPFGAQQPRKHDLVPGEALPRGLGGRCDPLLSGQHGPRDGLPVDGGPDRRGRRDPLQGPGADARAGGVFGQQGRRMEVRQLRPRRAACLRVRVAPDPRSPAFF
ncbi:MAG: prepilin-type N-terminal cleavage/methylation domain-containing protein [Desulfobacterales bacterium]|nr:prepilin-type N-terminal cleavage/methylation domain-containing protein [Desulfobacterales bacterium]